MSIWTPEQEVNRLRVALRMVEETVTGVCSSEVAKQQFEEPLKDLFNHIGSCYGWKVCPADSQQLPLVIP